MNAHLASQLPNPLNRVEFRTVGRQKIKAQNSPMIPEPGLQGSRVMIAGVIQNYHHFLSGKVMTKKMGQKNLKGFPIELFPLLGYQSPLLQTNGPKHPNRLMRRCLPENWIFHLRRNPHYIPRPMLLEMTLIQTPKIKIFSSQKPAQFFYMSPAPRDLLRQSPPAAYVGEIQTDGRCVGIGAPRFLTPMPVLYGEIAKFHPTAPGDIQRLWAAFANLPLTASSEAHPKKNAVLCPRHRAVHSTRPPGNGETNTGWFEENGPIDLPLHTCSSHGKGKAIHVAGGHSGLRRISIFPAVESTLQPWDHRMSVFPWLPPFG